MERKQLLVILSLIVTKSCFAQPENGVEHNERELNARGILSSLASNFMNRGFITSGTGVGASQIVSLNVTNLLVLFLLKALIFAAGAIGAGHLKGGGGDGYWKGGGGGEGYWKGGEYRTVEDEKFLTDDEVLMYLSYLTGSSGCLQNIACQSPEKAKKYVAAGELLLKLSKMFSLKTDLNYDMYVQELEHASNVGLAGGNCSSFECQRN